VLVSQVSKKYRSACYGPVCRGSQWGGGVLSALGEKEFSGKGAFVDSRSREMREEGNFQEAEGRKNQFCLYGRGSRVGGSFSE